MDRIVGSNKHGNLNEKLIVENLNGKKFSQLKTHFKTFILSICNDNNINLDKNDIIFSEFEHNPRVKPDFYIIIKEMKFAISCKLGSGNSVHQETIQQFTQFLREDLNAPSYIIENIRYYVWADGTIDGSGPLDKDVDGKIISRFTASEFKKLFPQKRLELLSFFKANEKPILERFIFQGASKNKSLNNEPLPMVDYVYHGNSEGGVWLSKEEIIDYHITNSNLNLENPKATLPVGRMTLQAWNISKEGKTEHKRGVIQAKYGNMKNDFSQLMFSKANNLGTFYGDMEENDISSRMNKNKNSSDWNIIIQDNVDSLYEIKSENNSFIAETQTPYKYNNENLFVVKVKGKKFSKITQKKVLSKADAYVIEAEIDKNILLMNQYSISEDDLEKINYKVVNNTGISVKRDSSKSYTYQKLSLNSFVRIFEEFYNNSKYLFIGNLFYTEKSKSQDNLKILQKLNVEPEEFLKYFKHIFQEEIRNISIEENSVNIKNYCTKKIKELIKSNNKISDTVFMGKGNFDEPYVAHYLYESGKLKENKIESFNVTTGSGRSKGKYTLIIKP
ncbi:hypothetical protein ACMGE5_06450 [Macrococcus equi]|uniref:hypothetical protein n=1 Tax=Macrococcus equi TaxID=3395462 RepID=UPI0039BE761B